MTTFYYLSHPCFFSPFLSQRKILNFCRWFLWKAPWTDQRFEVASFCKITRLSSEETFYSHKHIYSKELNNFHCVNMIPAKCKFTIIPSRFDVFKIIFCTWFKFCYCVLHGTNITYLTPQNKFLEDLRWFSYPQATMVPVRINYHFKKRCPPKFSGYSPANNCSESTIKELEQTSRSLICFFFLNLPQVFYEDLLKNFAKFTGKHMCHSLSFNKVTDGAFCENS